MDETADGILKRALAAYVQLLTPDTASPVYLAPDRFVTVRIYAAISGRTEKAIRRKIEDGKWLKDREFVHDPDGAVMIDREAVQRWVLRGL